ncbi:MAG: ribosome recycling factor [Acidimicrobiales bacterium]|nr:ribosome recycling factor [Acidimicrobiales bacterium]
MSELVELVLEDAKDRMAKAVHHTRNEFSSVRTGRASPTLVERLNAEAYGVTMSVLELASISVPEARQLMITPHDPVNLEAIERAIRVSDLGLSPSNDGRTLRLNFPPLTEERRKELVRLTKSMAEDGRIALRNIRRESRKDLEGGEKDKQISSDELERAEKQLDQLTQKYESRIDSALADKEAELLEV